MLEDAIAQKVQEVYAVKLGCKVTYSSAYDNNHINYQLDNTTFAKAWCARQNKVG